MGDEDKTEEVESDEATPQNNAPETDPPHSVASYQSSSIGIVSPIGRAKEIGEKLLPG